MRTQAIVVESAGAPHKYQTIELDEQMRDDEARHGAMAEAAGGERLPYPARIAMRMAANVMRAVAYRI